MNASTHRAVVAIGSLAAASSLLLSCTTAGSKNAQPIGSATFRTWEPEKRDDGWEVGDAREVGLKTAILDEMTIDLRRDQNDRNIHAVLIVKDGRLVYEQYLSGEDKRWRDGEIVSVSLDFHPDTLHDSRSVGKSILSALVGIALDAGAIPSLDSPVISLFPEHSALASPAKGKITFRNALTMSAGLEWNEADVPYTDARNDETRMNRHPDPVRFVLDREIVDQPGSGWSYNGGLPVLLGVAVSRAVNMPLGEYARDVLFGPLGITDVEWGWPSAWTGVPELAWDSPRGWAQVVHPAGNVWLRPRDLAKFGYLYLNDGRWNGTQVLPPGWAVESTRRRLPAGLRVNDDGEYGYGYLWWHDVYPTEQGDLEVHTAAGNGGQRVYVIPSLDLLVVVLAGGYNDPGSFWMPERLLLDFILPAVGREISNER